ncbi:MAG: hypothetical protein KAS63_04230 [Candidatus Heimdallarchaeota archaeon]|nr:hypothetical protein [Candidatus Heimdallarchaeota archaeon]MCK4954543.1 hypothetical protein [Candidatus Heimdallarchaeota archaeon]
MIYETISGAFSLLVGISILLFWLVLIILKKSNEYIEKPFERTFHIIAEIITALFAIVGGIVILTEQIWRFHYFFFAMGLVIYAITNAIGIYGQKKFWILVSILMIALITTASILITTIIKIT